MDQKTYIVTFFSTRVNLPALHQYLLDSSDINGFWNYIPLIYCIKSKLNATELAKKLRPFLPDGHMIAEVNSANLDGQLPTAAWSWFYNQPVYATPQLSGPTLGELLSGDDWKK